LIFFFRGLPYNEDVTTKKDAPVEPLIKPDDFESIDIEFEVVNTTTGTAFRKNVKIRLTQLTEKGMMLEVPRRACAQGHALSLKLNIRTVNPPESLAFEATAKVDLVENFEKGGDSVTVTLLQYDEKQWAQLNGIFSSRQKEIADFFTAARGY
jgi:hypothetical protein